MAIKWENSREQKCDKSHEKSLFSIEFNEILINFIWKLWRIAIFRFYPHWKKQFSMDVFIFPAIDLSTLWKVLLHNFWFFLFCWVNCIRTCTNWIYTIPLPFLPIRNIRKLQFIFYFILFATAVCDSPNGFQSNKNSIFQTQNGSLCE